MTRIHRARVRPCDFGALLVAILLAVAGCSLFDDGESSDESSTLDRQLNRLRETIEPFQDVGEAQKAGYTVVVAHPETSAECLEDGTDGGMGIHYLNPDLVDDAVSVTAPEVVIYEPQPDGALRLVAVEYIVPFTIRGDDQSPPMLFGQAGQEQAFKQNYTFDLWALHVWAWKDNPSGLFADWNPEVSCEHVGT